MKLTDERREAIATRYATWVVGLFADELTERGLAEGQGAVLPRQLLPMHEAIKERTFQMLRLLEDELDPDLTPVVDVLEQEPTERPTARPPSGDYPVPDGAFEPATKRSRRPPRPRK